MIGIAFIVVYAVAFVLLTALCVLTGTTMLLALGGAYLATIVTFGVWFIGGCACDCDWVSET